MPYCRNCGKEVASDFKVCPFCAENLNAVEPESGQSSQVAQSPSVQAFVASQAPDAEQLAKNRLLMEEKIKHHEFWFNFDVIVAVIAILITLFVAGHLGPGPLIIGGAIFIAASVAAIDNRSKEGTLKRRLFEGVLEPY